MIRAQNLSKIHYLGNVEVHAVKDVNLAIQEGEFVVITGHSGAGKSSLLYLLNLLDVPTSGEIYLENVNATKLTSMQRTRLRLTKLGYIFQDFSLLPELNALDNVRVVLFMQGISKKQATLIAKDVLERVGLGDRVRHFPSQLSGGQQQRVSIARAIAHNPKVLFADEPTANLDTKTAQAIFDYFKELNDKGQTIVMVTHERELTKMAKRIITMQDGKIIADSAE